MIDDIELSELGLTRYYIELYDLKLGMVLYNDEVIRKGRFGHESMEYYIEGTEWTVVNINKTDGLFSTITTGSNQIFRFAVGAIRAHKMYCFNFRVTPDKFDISLL